MEVVKYISYVYMGINKYKEGMFMCLYYFEFMELNMVIYYQEKQYGVIQGGMCIESNAFEVLEN